MSTELQRIALNRNQAGLGPAPAGGSLGQQIAANQTYYANQGIIPRANGGPMSMTGGQVLANEAARANRMSRYGNLTAGMPGYSTANTTIIDGPPGSGGGYGGGAPRGGSGGGFRMRPQDPNKRIGTRIGPRTSAEYIAENGGLSPQRESNLDAAYARGDFTNRAAPPSGTSVPMSAFDNPFSTDDSDVIGQMFKDPIEKTQPLAKGGAIKIGQKPYLVGEEGPELIMPRENGDGFVLPADVTAQVLPAMRNVKPRAQGGIMEMNTPVGRFAGGATPYGPAFAMQQTESQMGNAIPMTMDQAGLAMQPDERMIVNNGYQVDLPALTAPGNQSVPLLPDVVSGPWASPAMPADTSGLNRYVGGQVTRLNAGGAAPVSKYPGMVFEDISNQARYDNAIKAGQTEEAAMAYSEADVIPSLAKAKVGFEEMQQRMALRGMMYGDDFRDRQARNQTQLDLAARAARAPLGTPTAPVSQIPGLPAMRPSTQRQIDRNMERFYSTPQGALFAAQQAQQSIEGNIVDTAMLPVGNEGFVPIVRDAAGRQKMAGGFIPNARQTQDMTPAQAKELGLVAIRSENGRVTYGLPNAPANEEDFQITQIDGPMIEDPITKTMVPGPKQTVRVNKRTGDYEPLRAANSPAQATAAATPTGTSGPPQIRSADDWNALPKGTRYLDPSGVLKVKNS